MDSAALQCSVAGKKQHMDALEVFHLFQNLLLNTAFLLMARVHMPPCCNLSPRPAWSVNLHLLSRAPLSGASPREAEKIFIQKQVRLIAFSIVLEYFVSKFKC